jgi:hypothetical protein
VYREGFAVYREITGVSHPAERLKHLDKRVKKDCHFLSIKKKGEPFPLHIGKRAEAGAGILTFIIKK